MSKAKHNVISYSKVELDRILWKDLQSTERVPSQDIGYISYDHPINGERQFSLQTPEIKMDAGGIPDADGPYYKTTSARGFVKIPLEVNPNVKGESDEERESRASKLEKFKNTLMAIDNYMVENKEKIFGSASKAKKYTYQPIVRSPQPKDNDSDSDNEENQSEDGDDVVVSHTPMYMKAKIPIVWETENVDLDVYRVNEEGTEAYETDGKWSVIDDINTLDDLKKHVSYMRNVKFVLHACKYWAQKNSSNGSSTRMYGVTFKVRRVEVKPGRVVKDDHSEDEGELFADSDDDEDKVVQKFVEQAKVKNDSEDEEDNDSDSESESEEKVVEKKPVRRARKKAV